MLPIQPPVNPDSSKSAIANLHEALLFLDIRVDAVEVQNIQYGDSTRKLIMTLQRKLQLTEADGFVGAITAARLNDLLKEKGAFNDDSNFKISGRVYTNAGVPVAGIKAGAFDKQLSGDVALGEASTDRKGNYSITYKKPAAGKESPDIEVQAFDSVAGAAARKVIGRSAIKYNAGASEIIDVMIIAANVQPVSEYERLVKDIQPLLGQTAIKDIEETKDKQQVTYLSNKTGWDARMVAMAAQANKIGTLTKIDPSHIYALFRAGVPGSAAAITSLTPESAEKIIKKASESKIIPAGANAAETVKNLKAQTTQLLLTTVPATAVSNMSTMLALRLNVDQQKIFTETIQEAQNDTAKFWPALKAKGFADAAINSLKLDGKLGYLTGQNAPLIKKVYDKYQLKSEEDLVQKKLYKAEEWKTIIGTDVPKGVKPDEYATQLANEIKLSYPTGVAAEMIGGSEIKIGDAAPQQEAYKFFSGNQSKKIIGKEPIKTWEGFNALSPAAKTSAKTMERLYQMSPSDESMIALSKTGLTSAYRVAAFTKDEFMVKYGKQFPTAEQAELTYTKASEINSAAINLATGYLTARSMPNVYAITGQQQKVENAIIAYPTLEELFGNMDYCACEHCKSVVSPAAYLVELLQFIDRADTIIEKQNPITVLFNRRFDIQHIQLTCENTNVALPYIDLVNEILEHYLINGNLTTLTGRDITEETKQSDLLAEPQFVNEAACNELKKKVYPYHLPFHYALEALRLLFNVWDISLEDALAVYSTPLSSRKETLGLNEDEYKTLTDKTFKALPEYFGEAPAATIAALNTAIADGKTFSRRMQISYEELVQVLKTKFINPGIVLTSLLQKLQISLADLQAYYTGTLNDAQMDAKIPVGTNPANYGGNVKQWLKDNRLLIMGLITLTDIGPKATECNFAEVELRYALPGNNANQLTAISYHKFHRFIRLLKKTGWNIELLDNIITLFSPTASQVLDETNMDAAFVMLLNRIANFKKIADHLSYSTKKLPALLMLWDASIDISVREEEAARILKKMRITDMKDLAEVTGINPLVNDLENDEPSFLKFLYIVEELKNNSLKIADLNYILRHKDESGKLTLTEESLLKNIKATRDGLNTVEKENSIAPDNADFAFAKTKMALVYDASVTETFFGLLTGANTYSAAWIIPEEGLPAKLAAADANLGYDPFKKILTYKGIPTAAAKTNLDNIANALVIADMGVITLPADLTTFKNSFKAALLQIANNSNAELTAFGADYPELKTIYDSVKAQTGPEAQTKTLLNTILPELKSKLKTNSLRQILAALLKTEIETVNALTDKKETLQSAVDITKAVLFDFTQLEEKIVFNANQIYRFYIEAPATDDYLIYVSAPQNTAVNLSVNGQNIINGPVPVSGEIKNALPLSLKTGNLHLCDLIIGSLPAGKQALISWRTKGMAQTIIPETNIYVKAKVDNAKVSFIRLQKAAQIQRLLKLTPRELIHFASQNTETKGMLNSLDTNGTITAPNLIALWNKLKWVVFFAAVKKENEPDENSWVQVLENPNVKTPQNKNLLEGINLWSDTDLATVLTHFTLTRNDLSKLSVLKKVMKAMEIVSAVGYPASLVKTWITANPTYALVTDIKKTIKQNITEAAWIETMPTVSDPLRNKLRDALVSYILHYKKPSAEINTPDKLYEYFLIDVEMDACMKTSRIRMALSTVQLFIQRCLMNLEPDVAPSSIRAQQWIWMKRYRVWEANRKVFLYPENWLEPELRDNKSSFFKELEGELLQSEITDDSAELAFLNYLKKLDDVARLEIAGMYLEENEQGNQDDDILHVFGRTNGSTRQYYYRRYEYGYWTPWEKISLNIEGEYVFPVVWKKRLFLFWLNIFEKPAKVQSTENPKAMSESPGWSNNPKVNVEITMSWGEYYKNKWTSPKSTELTSPVRINGLSAFNPANILLYAKKEKPQNKSERLIFNLIYTDGGLIKGFNITYTSKNAPPVIEEDKGNDDLIYNVSIFNYDLYRSAYTGAAQSILYYNSLLTTGKELKNLISQPANAASSSVTENLITKKDILFGGFRLLPMRHRVENQWEASFVYADERCTFFVQPDEEVFTPLRVYDGYYHLDVYKKPSFEIAEIPPLMEQPIPGWPPEEVKIPGIDEVINNPWKVNEKTMIKNTNINKAMPVENNFVFGDTVFGSGGKVPAQLVDKFKNNPSNF
jgi:hypothetical protein